MNHDLLKNKLIAFVVGSTDLGGAERQAIVLAKELRDTYHLNIIFICLSKSQGSVIDHLKENLFSYKYFSYSNEINHFRRYFTFLWFVTFLVRKRVKILMPYTYVPNVVSGFLFRFTNVDTCIWNQRDEGPGSPITKISRISASSISAFISNSVGGKLFLVNKLKVPESKIHVISNGIEIREPKVSRSEWRKKHEIDEGVVIVCMLANITHFKDHEMLIQSWRYVKERQLSKDVVLLLVGQKGDKYEEINQLIVDSNIKDSVRALDDISDVSSLLHAIDIAVLCSKSEGSPNSVLESMAAGLPVLGSNIDGIRNAVSSESLPYLSKVGDYEDLGEKIMAFILNQDLRLKIGKLNKDKVFENFSIEKLGKETIQVLTGLY